MRTCRAIAEVDPRYPVGRTRLETVGVILCAVIMALSSTEVVQSSLAVLWGAFAKGALQSTRSHQRLLYTLYPISNIQYPIPTLHWPTAGKAHMPHCQGYDPSAGSDPTGAVNLRMGYTLGFRTLEDPVPVNL